MDKKERSEVLLEMAGKCRNMACNSAVRLLGLGENFNSLQADSMIDNIINAAVCQAEAYFYTQKKEAEEARAIIAGPIGDAGSTAAAEVEKPEPEPAREEPFIPLPERLHHSIRFALSWNHIAEKVHSNAIAHGWWVGESNDGELIALIHSELSEALEALREGNPESNKINGFSAFEEELADVVIRIMDLACARKLNLADAILAKNNFNSLREFKHGGKKF